MKRVHVTAPKTLVDELDEVASVLDMNRSEYVREALRRQLQHDLVKGRVGDE